MDVARRRRQRQLHHGVENAHFGEIASDVVINASIGGALRRGDGAALAHEPARQLQLQAGQDEIAHGVGALDLGLGDELGQLMHADERQRADVAFDAAGQHQRARRSAIGAPGLRRSSRLAAFPIARRARRDLGVRDGDGEALGADQTAHRHRVPHRAAGRIDEDRQAAIAERRDDSIEGVRRAPDDLALGRNPFRAVGAAGRAAARDADEPHRRQRTRRGLGRRRGAGARVDPARQQRERGDDAQRAGEGSARARIGTSRTRHLRDYRGGRFSCRALSRFPIEVSLARASC